VVEELFTKHLALQHDLKRSCLLIALPYCSLFIMILSINYGNSHGLEPTLLITCTIFQVLSFCFLLLYLVKLLDLKTSRRPEAVDTEDIEVNRSGFVNNPYFDELLFGSSRYDERDVVDPRKAFVLGCYALLFETSVIVLLAVWTVGSALTRSCPDFCSSDMPVLGIFFLWVTPLHMAVVANVRWPATLFLDISSKLCIALAFFVKADVDALDKFVLEVICLVLMWCGIWLPLLFYVHKNVLRAFQSYERYYRVVQFYKPAQANQGEEPVLQIFESFQESYEVSAESPTNNFTSEDVVVEVPV
jgi:hypothetical protein